MPDAKTVRRVGPLLAAAMVGAGAFLGFRVAQARQAGDGSTVWIGLVVLVLVVAAGAVVVPRWLGVKGAGGDEGGT